MALDDETRIVDIPAEQETPPAPQTPAGSEIPGPSETGDENGAAKVDKGKAPIVVPEEEEETETQVLGRRVIHWEFVHGDVHQLLAELEEVIFVYERNARLLSNKHMCNLY